MTPSRWDAWVHAQNDATRQAGRWREPREFDAAGPNGRLVATDTQVVSFASNDYLGLSQHPRVVTAAVDAIEQWGTGSGASRLVVGSRPVHHELEEALAQWRGTESSVLFPTGYAANLGLLSTLGGPGVRVHSDELNHASIVDGCRLARADGADLRIHPHTDLDALAAALAEPGARRQVVVTDTVFSMDGDLAPVDELIELCARHDALLVLDEAHSVLQPVPPARAADDGPPVVQVGTLSKTLGALGGFVTGPLRLTELLVNRARTYIFTTALSPADAAAALAAVGIVASAEGDALRARLRDNIDIVRPGHPTPIVPVIIGSETAAVEASDALLAQGLLVPAIRPPTVPPGTSRLRVALSAAHTPDQLHRLDEALRRLPALSASGTP
ncbi:MAG TPA: 8-amino-7-oxononanoate synthase [Acidimicrobiales bacterium]